MSEDTIQNTIQKMMQMIARTNATQPTTIMDCGATVRADADCDADGNCDVMMMTIVVVIRMV